MNQKELKDLYARHAKDLYHFLLAIAPNELEVHDLLQDIFVKLARQPKGLQGIRHERNYLFRICQNLVIDRVRSLHIRKTHDEALQCSPPRFSNSADPDTSLFRESLHSALQNLPLNQRTAVHLKLWQGWTFEEIAALESISTHTAASRYRYALAKLRVSLKPLYDEIR